MTTINRWGMASLGLLALLAAACADQSARKQPPQRAQLARAISTPESRDPPEALSPVASAILKHRMASHARDMGKLVSAIMVLDYPDIVLRANGIAEHVDLSRPISQDATELNASLPERFFRRQDDLKAAATDLSAAASALDPYRVADAYGKLSEGCVRCHADYRPRTSG
jgi:cytochrome c556